jgi:hypothetical protein
MELDEDTRIILETKLKLTNEEIAKYERGHLSLSRNDELMVESAQLSRKIGRELSDVAPMLDKCDVFNANKLLFNIAYKIGEMHQRHRLTFDDMMELKSKLDEYNTAGKMICECKNKVPRTY